MLDWAFAVQPGMDSLRTDEGLDDLAAQGVRTISMNFKLIETLDDREYKRCLSGLAARGIRVHTTHPHYGSYNKEHVPCAQDSGIRRRTLDMWEMGLERMAMAGIPAAPLHTGGALNRWAPPDVIGYMHEALAALEKMALRTGVVVAVENTFFGNPPQFEGWRQDIEPPARRVVFDDARRLLELIEPFDRRAIGVCWDIGHSHYAWALEEDMELLGPRADMLHIHDNFSLDDEHLPPGYGSLDWPAVIDKLRAIGYRGDIFIEAHGNSLDEGLPERIRARSDWGRMIRETEALFQRKLRAERAADGGRYARCPVCRHLIMADCGCLCEA